MNKKSLTETDIRTKFITPAICGPDGAGWDVMTQVREEAYFTKGRVIVRGKTVRRGEAKKADYLLYFKPNLPIAVVEAKDNHHAVGAGMQQALEYAEILDVPFAYSSNGDAFLEHDRTATGGTVTREIPLGQFPSPEQLWSRYCKAKGLTPKQVEVATQDYHDDGAGNLRYVGRFSIYAAESGRVQVNPDKLIRFRVDREQCDPRYVCYAMNAAPTRERIGAMCATTAGNIGLSAGKMKTVDIPLPPLAEQRRIVAKVDELMTLVDKLEAQLASARATASVRQRHGNFEVTQPAFGLGSSGAGP